MKNKKSIVILGVLIVVAVAITIIAGGGKQETGVIIELEDDETVDNQIEQDSEEIVIDNSTPEKITTSILGIWVTEGGDIYTLDTESEYSVYIADLETFQYGTYETDEQSYITFKSNDGTDTKYSISISTERNEYNEEFITIQMQNENLVIKLIKQYEINEAVQEQEQQQENEEIIEE